jgi:hypothetical protein
MRQCLETFLMLLSDNLAIPVHHVREDKNLPGSNLLQMNCINVQIVAPSFGNAANISTLVVSLDVVNDDELTALDWLQQTTKMLQKGGYTPKMNYTFDAEGNISLAVPVGTNIWWHPNVIKFRPVKAEANYSRFTCLFPLNHHIS